MHRPTYVFEAGKHRRQSSFHEFFDHDYNQQHNVAGSLKLPSGRHRSGADIVGDEKSVTRQSSTDSAETDRDLASLEGPKRLLGKVDQKQFAGTKQPWYRMYTRLSCLAVILALTLSLVQGHPALGHGRNALPVADGLAFSRRSTAQSERRTGVSKRDTTDTDVCKRWSQQSALVNGTLYLYGGRATQDQDQTTNEWNNDFLTLDLTKNWTTGSPGLKGLARPSGPPAVANGYLWSSHTSLFLYGGEFSDTPVEPPVAFALWEYNIQSGDWVEHTEPKTSAGKNSEAGGQAVQRVAEGAGVNVPSLGRGWYFGGHEDFLTTEGWSYTTPREYLRSFLEFTFPGATNDGVNELSGGKRAGNGGVFRNVTSGGKQDTASFTERADGALVYVPGWGKDGILLALGGGTNESFTQMNVIDVFDIAGSTWYKQATSGPTPHIRVNPCAVVAAAADGSSYNIYMFGGQNLTPYKSQTQYQDMWILSVPSFTWIQVDMDKQAVPYARSGHTCNIWDGQMVVVGGYIGNEIPCESPGIYVFDLSSLQWVSSFTSLSAVKDSDNPFSQQLGQRKESKVPTAGLEGSFGYQVPALVISAIGGDGGGHATVTAPVKSADSGPLATGRPVTYPGSSSEGNSTSPLRSGNSGGGTNIGAIVAGAIAGFVAVLAVYFAFCAWVYRKQLRLYKNHVAATQRAQLGGLPGDKLAPGASGSGLFAPLAAFKTKGSSEAPSAGNSEKRGSMAGMSTSGRWGHYPSGSVDSTGLLLQHASGGAPGDRGSGTEYDVGVGVMGAGYNRARRRSSDGGSSTGSLVRGLEPSYIGVLMHPRKSLRVVNND